ncbi:maleylpyruvate isomerase family mycothiol-dependent enzyme [Nocardioides pelophilus]|uniref:maleylpyruvate isomerase family mycothiol-dependent enzyme n=1 Tax=Nocardioides pelophilus TaxID=2172019 RepID=UPI00160435E7|nr:maleylpyruvate isomerase family mycothiol-dependent enzyme [Nocardioides pelophilus]
MTDLISLATDRLLTTVDGLPDSDWGAPSVCVGWSRAHVIAHLALNAEGLGGAVRGLLEGRPTPMYASNESRDADIAALAARPPAEVRERLRSAADFFADVVGGVPDLPPDATFDRTPGGIVMPAALVPTLRLREVEIHHADLDAGYGYASWPTETAAAFLDRDAPRYDGAGFTAHATDLDRDWAFGSPTGDAPVVSGPASALAWWASGRDPGDHLTSSTGTLPTMEGR